LDPLLFSGCSLLINLYAKIYNSYECGQYAPSLASVDYVSPDEGIELFCF